MPRPPEYDNLIKSRAFEQVARTEGAVQGYLKNAEDDLAVAKSIDENRPKQRFTLAYEGFYGLVQAVLEFYEVRTKESGRNLAILRVCADLGLSPDEIRLVSEAHGRRNDTIYRSPFPPVSRAEALGLIGILEKSLPLARALTSSLQDR